jgi:hypothetical protein
MGDHGGVACDFGRRRPGLVCRDSKSRLSWIWNIGVVQELEEIR